MSNFDHFNFATFEIFHQCCQSHPSIACITVESVVDAIESYYKTNNVSRKRLEDVAIDTTDWLVREGYLVNRGNDPEYIRVTISEKGLRAFNRIPTSIQANSFREIFSTGLKTMSSASITALITELFK